MAQAIDAGYATLASRSGRYGVLNELREKLGV